MKRTWQCPKCAGTRVGYFDEVSDADRIRGARTLDRSDKESWIAASVEAFVCTDCGYFEEYVKDAGNVAWDKLPHFRWCRR